MRILQLDCDSISYELIKPEARVYEENAEKGATIDDALVLLVSVEKGDEHGIADRVVDDAAKTMAQLKRKKLVIYPFAHLSSDLAAPKEAMELIDYMAEKASKSLEVRKAPFGWNKKLSLAIKGHPLAEQSRSYSKDATKAHDAKSDASMSTEDKAMKEEEKVKSTWYILDEKGTLTPVEKFDFSKHQNLKKFADYEIKKTRTYQREPAHIKLMRALQLVDYEPGSDAGNMRFYPNGKLVKDLLERYVTSRVLDYGAVEVETPIMYDYGHKALKAYLERFPARHYVVKSDDKEFFLRFSGDFGQFLMVHDATISYRQLPFRFYELTHYSFRREKSGEVMGLKRLRAFTMPDMHTLCADVERAKEEFGQQFGFCQDVLSDIGIEEQDYEAAIRFTDEFWNGNEEFVKDIVKTRMKRPVLIERWNFRYAYFDPKFEFNVIDSMDKATAVSTVQIDHENGERYDMSYVAKDGKKTYPILLHCSPSGAIERVIYALLETAYVKSQNEKAVPELPMWLSPTQVRLVAIADKHVAKCAELAEQLRSKGIRADVDDTDATLDKKVMNAEQEWVPLICVVGDREINEGKLSVRIRKSRKQEKMSQDELAEFVLKLIGKMPKARQSLPMLLSKRPTFFG